MKFGAIPRNRNTLRFPFALSRFVATLLLSSQTDSLIPQESTCIPAALFNQLILVKSMQKQQLYTS